MRAKNLGKLSLLLLALSVLCGAPTALAATKSEDLISDTELIDTPTAEVLDYYGLQVKTRFLRDGGVLAGLNFGVLNRLNLGASATVDKMIGTDDPMRLLRPEIQAKFRFYDGGKMLPAFSLGYDGQGYYYDTNQKKYYEKGRGLYVVGTKEILTPGLSLNPGINMSDFDNDDIFFFTGLSYNIENNFALMAEWDAIQRFNESRLNLGARFYVTPFFQIDLAVREIGRNRTLDNGVQQRPERIAQLRYTTSF
ncbi:MAG: hypothetical protein GX410_05075 [Elusimicrobia bacterium]|nr:hypothetical protein [Elusimicrobiota bacterium]